MLPRVLRLVFDHVSSPCPRGPTSYKVLSRAGFRAPPVHCSSLIYRAVLSAKALQPLERARFLSPTCSG